MFILFTWFMAIITLHITIAYYKCNIFTFIEQTTEQQAVPTGQMQVSIRLLLFLLCLVAAAEWGGVGWGGCEE